MTYVVDFQEKAAEISGKSAEELFSFTDRGPLHRRMERELAEMADSMEKAKKENDVKEKALKEAQEAVKLKIEENNKEWRKVISDREKDFDDRLESAKKEHFDEVFNKMKDEVEILKVRLEETENRNKDLKLDILDLKKHNEKLNEKSVEDSLDIADISQQNEELVKMVTKGSTLDEVANTMEVPVVLVDGKLDDDPILTNDEVFEDGGAEAASLVGRKHRLSPHSVDSGLPKEKQLVRTKSIEKSVIVRSDLESTTPSLLPPPAIPPPPPTPHKRSQFPPSPPPPPKKSPPNSIFRPIGKGAMVEIFDETSGNITAKILSCQVKRAHKEYQKFKDHWNVKIINGNNVFKAGDERGFDLTNTKSYKIINFGSAQQSSTLASRESKGEFRILE